MLMVGLTCAVTVAAGQPPQPSPGAELLRGAARAEPVSAVRYSVEQRGVGPRAGSEAVVKGTVIQQRAEVPDAGNGGGRYRAFGEVVRPDGTTLPFDWSYDGATLRVLDPKEKVVLVGSSRVDLQACKLEYSIVSPK